MAVALVASTLFGGQAGAAGAAPETTARTIVAWSHAPAGTDELLALQAAAAVFNRTRRNVRVEIQSVGMLRYEENVHTAALNGRLPCLFEADGPLVQAYAWTGYLQPLDRFVPKPLRRDLLPSILEQGTFRGHLYTLGQFDSGLGLWGDQRHLRAAGVRIATFEAPWSLAEFEQALQKLTLLPSVERAISLNVGTGRAEYNTYAFSPLIQGFGGDLIDRRHYQLAKGTLDGPNSVAAMQRLQKWLQAGQSRSGVDAVDDFERGRTALSWNGHWKYPAYHAALGDDLVLMPLPDFGHGSITGSGSWSWGIASSCKEPAAAWAFIAHLLSTQEVLRVTHVNGAVPALRSALALSPLYGTRGPLRLFARQIEAGRYVTRPPTPAYGAIRAAFGKAFEAIVAGGDVQAELSKAASNIDADIARNQGYRP